MGSREEFGILQRAVEELNSLMKKIGDAVGLQEGVITETVAGQAETLSRVCQSSKKGIEELRIQMTAINSDLQTVNAKQQSHQQMIVELEKMQKTQQ